MKLAIVVLTVLAITTVNGQWGGMSQSFAGSPFGGQNFRGGNGWFPGGFPGGSQQNTNEPTMSNCVTGYGGNILEVSIKPAQQQQFNPFMQFQGRSSSYEIEVKVDSGDIDGHFTVVITDLSTDKALCSESDLGFIATNGQPQNGLMSLFSGRLNQQSAGIVGEIDVAAGTINEEYYTGNNLYNNFRDFRGLGVALCTSISGGDNSEYNPFFQMPMTPARQTCEMPVLCCKLGLSAQEYAGK